jgi:hypothetical protein
MRRGDTKRADAILLLAKAAFADRKRRSPVTILVTLAILVLLLTGLAWWFWPRPELPPLVLAAYDQVALPDESIRLVASVEPRDAERGGVSLSGCDLYFQEVKSGQLLGKVITQHDGSAILESSFPAGDLPVEIIVRYPGRQDRRRGLQDKVRVFVWPADSALLLVDADHALAEIAEEKLWTANNLDIRPRKGAAAALRKLRTKYQIIYLVATADRPSRYGKLRAWLERGAPAQEQFPDGPVIAPMAGPLESDPTVFQRAVLAEFKGRFRGTIASITNQAQAARLFQEAGMQSFQLEAPAELEGITALKNWGELPGHLLK